MSDEQSMIERVARAIDLGKAKIADKLISMGCERMAALDILPIKEARAAIEAMREPTEWMERAGLREITIDATWFKPAWQAAIDAILAERKP